MYSTIFIKHNFKSPLEYTNDISKSKCKLIVFILMFVLLNYVLLSKIQQN